MSEKSGKAKNSILYKIFLGIGILYLTLLVLIPLATVFSQAFTKGWGFFAASITDPDTAHAIFLTLLIAVVAVPVNTTFGILAAWAITRFQFKGKNALISLIDLPFSISPIVVGVMYVLLYGAQSQFGEWLREREIKIIFSVFGLFLVNAFVTLPFVARELIPLMQAQGSDEEESALSLGASGWQIFWHVTLPNVKWALLYGVILCNARSMGEFGAASLVSGSIRRETSTLPLQVDILYNEYNAAAAFAAASLLSVVAVLTIVAKTILEIRSEKTLSFNSISTSGHLLQKASHS